MSLRLWQELRRRKVFRTSGFYIVGAWVVIQVGDVFFPAWGLPDSGLRYLFIAAVACFPVALIFGWFYDITAQGVMRTPPADEAAAPDLRLKKRDFALLAALLGIVAVIVFESAGMIRKQAESETEARSAHDRPLHSIAVLPFRNLDEAVETSYFSDGITEDIQVGLSLLGKLHVKAASSSFALRNSDLGPEGISELLGVRYLLEGSVRRDGEYVRVTAHLVDEHGFRVWSDTFDREFASLFVVQSEIASTVASRIVEQIVPARELPAGRTTSDMEAYNAYLRGRAYFEARTTGWKQAAETAFRRAIELDPTYAPPYAGLATLVVNSGWGPHWEEARRMAEKSLELDPNLPIGHAVLGMVLTVLDEPERGLEVLRRAIELDPSLSIAYQWITLPLDALGRPEEAVEMQRRGLEIDPLNSTLIRNNSGHASENGDFDRAESLLLRLTQLPEPAARTYYWLHLLYGEWGRYAKALAAIREHMTFALSRGANPNIHALVLDLARLGLREETAYWYELWRTSQAPQEVPIFETLMLTRLGDTRWLKSDLDRIEAIPEQSLSPDEVMYNLGYGGLARIHAGDIETGIRWLERALAAFQREMALSEDIPGAIDLSLLENNWGRPTAVDVAFRLAFAYSSTGREADAQIMMRHLEGIFGTTANGANPSILEQRALYRALSGDAAAALASLEAAASLGWCNYLGITHDPAWTPTLELPEFEEILTLGRSCIDEQRALADSTWPDEGLRAEVEASLRR